MSHYFLANKSTAVITPFQTCCYTQKKEAALSTCPGSVELICLPLGGGDTGNSLARDGEENVLRNCWLWRCPWAGV